MLIRIGGVRTRPCSDSEHQRPDVVTADLQGFLDSLRHWLQNAEQEYAPTLTNEPDRLLQAGEYRAAAIAAITLLESTLRDRYNETSSLYLRPTPLKALLEMAQVQGALGDLPINTVQEWVAIRNQAVHMNRTVSRVQATQIVRGVSHIIRRP